ncbi:hypothetical protein [Chloracidobacterium aggregatum]|uniref:hypothetical protein n=1 Tax=Chloracidobacterium aggregatum TaxID=2851959 RepID=UPI001FED6C2B|nr:hypothetical protein [Chloracidobacterium aggregatum]
MTLKAVSGRQEWAYVFGKPEMPAPAWVVVQQIFKVFLTLTTWLLPDAKRAFHFT